MEINSHVLHVVERLPSAILRRNLRNSSFNRNDAFHGHITGRRAKVLEELINETDRQMFFERVLNSTVRYDSEGISFQHCGVEGPNFFLAAYAMSFIRWNLGTEGVEEEDLPLLQGVTLAGHTCDLGLSAFADDVAKKIVGRSEKELF